jgi:hypothetical protein
VPCDRVCGHEFESVVAPLQELVRSGSSTASRYEVTYSSLEIHTFGRTCIFEHEDCFEPHTAFVGDTRAPSTRRRRAGVVSYSAMCGNMAVRNGSVAAVFVARCVLLLQGKSISVGECGWSYCV